MTLSKSDKINLSLRFVKTKQLSADLIKKFKSLLSSRTDVDYGDFVTVD